MKLPSKKILLLTLLVMGAVVACGPVLKAFYSYTPPSTNSGRACTNQCLTGKSYCSQNCHIRQLECEDRADDNAAQDYDNYARAQRRDNRAVKKTVSDFRHYCSEENSCNESCTSDYNLCYTNCGGRVTTTTQCTAFCEPGKI